MRRHVSTLVFVCLTASLIVMTGCDGGGAGIAFTRVEHKDGSSSHYLFLSSLTGPSGSTVDAPSLGTYTAKGTYDVSGTRWAGETLRIRLSMEWHRTDGEATEFTTTEPSGSYEVSATFSDDGFGPPMEPGWIRVELLVPGTWADWITPYNDGALDVDSMIAQVTPACSGQGVSGTAPYSAGGSGIHPVLIVPDPNVESWKDQLKTAWIPSAIAECELVVCCDYDWDVLNSCAYTGGYVLNRVRPKVHVKLREALTGNIVAETTLVGQAPGGCPATRNFTSRTASLTGAKPTYAELEAWLQPYVEP